MVAIVGNSRRVYPGAHLVALLRPRSAARPAGKTLSNQRQAVVELAEIAVKAGIYHHCKPSRMMRAAMSPQNCGGFKSIPYPKWVR